MPACYKLITFLIALMAIFLFSLGKAFAQVAINEFLPNSTSPAKEWVELYNPDNVDLTTYWLDDDISFTDDSGSSTKKSLSSLNTSNPSHPYLEFSSFLNNNGDYVVLFSSDGSIVDQYQYTSDPGKDISIGRSPDGAENWVVLDSVTPGAANNSTTLTAEPSPSLTPSPSPTKATYKINEVKDEDNNILSSVKIYVDDVYIHHYVPETLIFCDGCQCNAYVDCGFGEHTIKLEKSDFANWGETKTINAGDDYEVNPIMNPANSVLPSLSPTPSLSPSPTPSPKPIKVTGVTLSGKILGEEESSPAGFFPWEATKEAESQEATSSSKAKFVPKLFLGLGLLFLVSSGLYLWYTQSDYRGKRSAEG